MYVIVKRLRVVLCALNCRAARGFGEAATGNSSQCAVFELLQSGGSHDVISNVNQGAGISHILSHISILYYIVVRLDHPEKKTGHVRAYRRLCMCINTKPYSPSQCYSFPTLTTPDYPYYSYRHITTFLY